MHARHLLLSTVILITACATTAEVATQSPVPAGQNVYVIDPGHTFPNFEITHLGLTTHRGRFNKTSGWVMLDRAAHDGSVEIKIDADSLDTGDARLEQRLRAEDFFDTASYPTITFKSNQLHFAGDVLVGVDGELTLRGVTRPVALTVTSFRCGNRPITGQEACGANAETTIKRADFGITAYPSAIGADVKLLFQVEAVKR